MKKNFIIAGTFLLLAAGLFFYGPHRANDDNPCLQLMEVCEVPPGLEYKEFNETRQKCLQEILFTEKYKEKTFEPEDLEACRSFRKRRRQVYIKYRRGQGQQPWLNQQEPDDTDDSFDAED